MIVKQPAFGVFLVIIVVFILLTSYENNKEKKEIIEKSVERIRQELEKCSFKVSKEICLMRDDRVSTKFVSSELIIDDDNKQIALCTFYKDDLKIIPFEELLNCEILEDDVVVRSFAGALKSDSTLVIGMATEESKSTIRNLSIKIETSNADNSEILIPIITTITNCQSYEYRKARNTASDVYSSLVEILKKCNRTSTYFT